MKRLEIGNKTADQVIKQVSRYFKGNPNRKEVRIKIRGIDRRICRKDDYFKAQLKHILKPAQ